MNARNAFLGKPAESNPLIPNYIEPERKGLGDYIALALRTGIITWACLVVYFAVRLFFN